MADPPPFPDSKGDTGDDTGEGPDREAPPGVPLWVKVSGIIVIVLVVVVGIMLFTGVGGPHGPSRHLPSGGQPPASVIGDDRPSGGGPVGQTPPIERRV